MILSTISASTARTLRSIASLKSGVSTAGSSSVIGVAPSASFRLAVVTTVPETAGESATFCHLLNVTGESRPLLVPYRAKICIGVMSKQTIWLTLELIVVIVRTQPRSQFWTFLPNMASAASLVSAICPANLVNPGLIIVSKSTAFQPLSYGLLAVPGAWGHIAVST